MIVEELEAEVREISAQKEEFDKEVDTKRSWSSLRASK